MNMLWSAQNNVFIPALMRQQYETAGWDLSDCTEANSELAAEFMGQPPIGKVRAAGRNGFPQWDDISSSHEVEQQSIGN